MKNNTQPLNLMNLIHHEEIFGNKIPSQISHQLAPTNKSHSLYIEENIITGIKPASDEIMLKYNKQSASDPSNPNLVENQPDLKNLLEGRLEQ